METTVQVALKTLSRWARRVSVQPGDTASQVATTVSENGGAWLTKVSVIVGDSGMILLKGIRSQLTKGQKL